MNNIHNNNHNTDSNLNTILFMNKMDKGLFHGTKEFIDINNLGKK